MSGLNVAEIINEWVEKELALPFTIYNDAMPASQGEAACLRHDPAPAAEKRFLDGSRLLKWNLTYYIRSGDRASARNYAFDITDRLDGKEITDSETGVKIMIEAQTLPQFISIDDKNNTIYSAAIVATYLEPNTEDKNNG